MLAEAGAVTAARVVTRASGETTPRPGTAPSHYSTTTPGRQTPSQPGSLQSQSNDNDNKSQLETSYESYSQTIYTLRLLGVT